MRDLLHNTLADARSFVGSVVDDLRDENRLSDDEVLAQYSAMRGNVPQLIAFAQERVPAGEDPLQEALRYESEMEALLKQRQQEE